MLWGCSPNLYWVWETYFMHAKALASEMPLCDWKGHHHTPVQCAAFHSVRKERWEKQESAMMYFIRNELWGLLQTFRRERWQCGWKCLVLKKDLEKRTKHWIKQMARYVKFTIDLLVVWTDSFTLFGSELLTILSKITLFNSMIPTGGLIILNASWQWTF